MNIPDQIFNRAMKEGFTKEAACALLANIQAESAFVPNNLEDSYEPKVGMTDQQYTEAVDSGRYTNFVYDRCGYGLCQWTYWSRKKMLLEYAINNNASIGSFEMQREFIFYEMRQSFPAIWTACRTSHDLEYLVHELLYKWENPDEKENNMKRRLASAQGFYQKYAVWESSKEETKMTKEQAVQKVLSIAKAEIGYHETGDNWTKYAQEMDRTNWYNGGKNGFAWCDVFVDWLFYKAFGDPLGREMICQPTGSAGAGCLYSAQYYKNAGRWFQIPEVGDQIFFTYAPGEYSHTGIVESVQSGIITTIEGNTSDQVARRQYTNGASQIAGYGRPKWELATGASPSPDPTPQPSPSPSDFGRILKKGMRGDDVKKMQELLIQLGYGQLLQPDGADGDFGNNTYNAVVQFQMKNGLYVDGEVGPDTLGKMQELAKEGASDKDNGKSEPSVIDDEDKPRPVGISMVRNGDKGNLVKLAQAALYHLGYELSIDGIFGNTFEKKIKKFQEENGLKVSGIIDSETWKSLLDIPYRGSGSVR